MNSINILKKYHPQIDEKDHMVSIVCWDLPYQEYLTFLKEATREAKESGRLVLLITSHPLCLTMGRGNQRGMEKELVGFDKSGLNGLDIEVYNINRGGGLTFHHPGQVIIYPIMKVHPEHSLYDHTCQLLKICKSVIDQTYGLKTQAAHRLLGVWYNRKKLASVGVGLERFMTQHGLALNLYGLGPVKLKLSHLFPCGLDFQTYSSIEELFSDAEQKRAELVEGVIKEYSALF